MQGCSHPTESPNPCPQRAGEDGVCHYHRKMQAGLCDPVSTYLDEPALVTMFVGHKRGDSRRLDQYVTE